MKKHLYRKKTHWQYSLVAGLISLFLLLGNIGEVFGQIDAGDDWTQPVNVSNSGSSSDPIVLVDSQSVTHLFWTDDFEGNRYAQVGVDGTWSEPRSVIVPFSGNESMVIPGPADTFYAFWLIEGELFYSWAKPANLGLNAAWQPVRRLAEFVLCFDVFMDEDQAIHLAYLTQSQPNADPAGIYYTQKPLGRGWTVGQPVYTSPYFRTMDVTRAHVQVTAGVITLESTQDESGQTEKQIYVAWDEPYLYRSMINRSTDGSNYWPEPLEIDAIEVMSGSSMVFGSDLIVWNNQVLMVWKNQVSQTDCEILYKTYDGAGDWGDDLPLYSSLTGCPAKSGFIAGLENYLLWYAEDGSELVLSAWNGSQWSDVRSETSLSGFWDPVSEKTLTLEGRHLAYHAGENQLVAVGSDVNGSQDIWYTRKALEDVDTWYAPYASWSSIQRINYAQHGLSDVHILTDSQGSRYMAWLQSPDLLAERQPLMDALPVQIHFARLDETGWSEPVAITVGGEHNPTQFMAVTADSDDLMAAWRNESGCQITFTSVPIHRALSTREWMDPVLVPTPPGICSSPMLVSAGEGHVYAAYAVLVNEGRGIYINHSADGGRSWEQAVQVFDGQASGWEMVDQPILVISGSRMHVLWQQPSPYDPQISQGVGYAYSDDGGMTWRVADEQLEEKMEWAGLAASSNNSLLRSWEYSDFGLIQITTQISLDGGQNWSMAVTIERQGELIGAPVMVPDGVGGIHLLLLIYGAQGKATLEHWVWDNGGWNARENLDTGYVTNGDAGELSAVVSPQNELGVAYSTMNGQNGAQSLYVVFSQGGEGLQDDQAPLVSWESLLPSTTNPEILENDVLASDDLAAATPTPATFSKTPERVHSFSTWIAPIGGALAAGLIVTLVFWKRMTRDKK
ncbi:MAG: exo-alpha-sialidase [Anaerolineae bacterium]|nr:exo-alpha-sialidase [Anaerolineae bacterium]